MTIDNEKIKKALDHFENDEFVDAKEILTKEINRAKNDHLKNKLDLKTEIDTEVEVEDSAEDDKSEE